MGGGLYLTTNSDSPISSVYTLNNITVLDNYAEHAGGLYTNNVNLKVTSSWF
jgi:hypothetical protein